MRRSGAVLDAASPRRSILVLDRTTADRIYFA
jgi:hypothetical protein